MFKSVLAQLKDAVVIYDTNDDKVVFANESASQILGLTRQQILQNISSIRSIVHPNDATSYVSNQADGKECYHRFRVIDNVGGKRWLCENVYFVLDEVTQHKLRVGIYKDVTEEVNNERHTQRKIWFLSSLIDGLAAAVFRVDNEGKYLYVNHYYKLIDGIEEKEIIGKSVYDFLPPEDVNRVRNRLRYAVNNPGKLQKYTYRRLTRGGEIRWFNSNVISVVGSDSKSVEIQGVAIDITDQVNINNQLQLTLKDIEGIINNTTNLIWSVDLEKKYKYVNKAFRDWAQKTYDFTPVPGERFDKHKNFPKSVARDYEDHYDRALAGNNFYVRQNSGNGEIQFEISFNPIVDMQGNIVGAGCFAKDITNRILSQVVIKKHSQKLQTIGHLSSHVLRRPVASLLGLWDILDKENLANPENVDVIKHIGVSTKELDDVIRNIVDNTFIKID